MIRALLLALLGAWLSVSASAVPPASRVAALRRGVNITNWFRFPASRDSGAVHAYLTDAAMADLRRAGFTFVRVPFDPAFATGRAGRDLIVTEARRLNEAGLAVVLVPASAAWRLEDRPADRAALLNTWRLLAPALRNLDPALTFPEVLNEPVFAGDAVGWARLQGAILGAVRAALPENTILLTGADWSSLGGLAALAPLADPDVIYTFHFYDPAELTSLAAYRPGLDRAALARLPFPVDDPAACARDAASADSATQALVRFVCGQHWDRSAIEARIARAAAWAARNGAVVLMGEFGASARLNAPARLAWIGAVRQACEQAGIGWALWGYEDVMGFDLPRPPGPRPRLNPALLTALDLSRGQR